MPSRQTLRRTFRLAHLWLGLISGLFVCLMAVSGAVVTLRPALAEWMAPLPVSPQGCAQPYDWDRATDRIEAFAHEPLDRIYAFPAPDPRFHVRLATSRPVIYDHVIYDACAGEVLGTINLAWMDWLVDLHHNLLAGRAGRACAGAIGIALLISGVSGLLLWLLGKPRLTTAFRIQRAASGAPRWRDAHRAVGLGAVLVLLLEAYTGLWLCYPQAMRATLSAAVRLEDETRPPRPPKPDPSAPLATLAAVMTAAHDALPDGQVREVRLPHGPGLAQVRMWRTGDFRSLGNNVVSVSTTNARVVGVDRYDGKASAARFVQAMSGLHYAEWGGIASRLVYALGGLATVLLFVSGFLIWRGPATSPRVRHGTSMLPARSARS